MLFDDYAARFARGERPDARAYLARAGEGADELARLIEVYLERAPSPAPDEESVALTRAWVEGHPPLLALRTRRGVTRDKVVDALMSRLGLDPGKRDKVKRYYHQLENGLLEPRRVDRSVWEVLAETLKARASELAAQRVRPLRIDASMAYFRVSEAAAPAMAAPMASGPPPEEDEIDRLFRGASDPCA